MPKKHSLPIWAYDTTLTLVHLLNRSIADMQAVANSGHIPDEDRTRANNAVGLTIAALELIKNVNSKNEELNDHGNGQAQTKTP